MIMLSVHRIKILFLLFWQAFALLPSPAFAGDDTLDKALFSAVQQKRVAEVKAVLARGADVSVRDAARRTPGALAGPEIGSGLGIGAR